jgi:hypothetical protein
MSKNQQRLEAGLVYLMAMALKRRCKDHIALSECAEWLRDQGYEREAEQLAPNFNNIPVFTRRGSCRSQYKSF